MKAKTRGRAAIEKGLVTPAQIAAAKRRAARLRKAPSRLETDPRFLERVRAARASLRAGRGARLEDT